MKKSLLIAVLASALAVVFVLGLTGAIRLSQNPAEEDAPKNGRLVGIFVTWENEYEDDTKPSEDRYLYAVKTTEKTEDGFEFSCYEFEQRSGLPFYSCRYLENGEWTQGLYSRKITDIHSAYNSGDKEESESHTGTLYLCSDGNFGIFRIYNVYQAEDERVYIDTSEYPNSFLPSWDQTITSSFSRTLPDGTAESFSIALQVKKIGRPDDTVKMIEMNADHEVVRETVIRLSGKTEDFVLNRDTEYVITEQLSTDRDGTKTERKLYAGDSSGAEFFVADDIGICTRQFVPFVRQ